MGTTSRAFYCGGNTLLPIADLMNNADAAERNAHWSCDDESGTMSLKALRDVPAGHELTWSFHPDGDTPISTLTQYGFFDAAQARENPWPSLECNELRSLKIGKLD